MMRFALHFLLVTPQAATSPSLVSRDEGPSPLPGCPRPFSNMPRQGGVGGNAATRSQSLIQRLDGPAGAPPCSFPNRALKGVPVLEDLKV